MPTTSTFDLVVRGTVLEVNAEARPCAESRIREEYPHLKAVMVSAATGEGARLLCART